MKIITYKMSKKQDGSEESPIVDFSLLGCSLQGDGIYWVKDRCLGYVEGPDDAVIDAAIASLTTKYQIEVIDQEDALAWLDTAVPPASCWQWGLGGAGDKKRFFYPAYWDEGLNRAVQPTDFNEPGFGVDLNKNILRAEKKRAARDIEIAAAKELQKGLLLSNGIRVQVEERDMMRWTQLTTILVAFKPAEVSIRDYDNVIHKVPLAEAMQMMGEIAAFGQEQVNMLWQAKNGISEAATLTDVEAAKKKVGKHEI